MTDGVDRIQSFPLFIPAMQAGELGPVKTEKTLTINDKFVDYFPNKTPQYFFT